MHVEKAEPSFFCLDFLPTRKIANSEGEYLLAIYGNKIKIELFLSPAYPQSEMTLRVDGLLVEMCLIKRERISFSLTVRVICYRAPVDETGLVDSTGVKDKVQPSHRPTFDIVSVILSNR